MAAYQLACPATLGANTTLFNYYDVTIEGSNCPVYSAFFGVMGATSAMIFSGACIALLYCSFDS